MGVRRRSHFLVFCFHRFTVMSLPEPIAVMEQWVRDARGAFSLPLSLSLGLQANNDTEAVPAILDWIRRPRDLFALRSTELSLRAFIDFECALGTSDSHQDMIDGDLLGAVDAGIIPPKNRAAINDALGARPNQRQRALEAAEAWRGVRPSDQAIYEWWWRRFRASVQLPPQPPSL